MTEMFTSTNSEWACCICTYVDDIGCAVLCKSRSVHYFVRIWPKQTMNCGILRLLSNPSNKTGGGFPS